MPAHAENEVNKQMLNPLKVLTSGVERTGNTPFFAGGKWRFVERVAWWNDYDDDTPVVVGHYWRRRTAAVRESRVENSRPFDGVHWLGARGNVFCVDYSVGGRWQSRLRGDPPLQAFALAALQWPERTLVFDDGSRQATQAFGESPQPVT